MQQSRHLRIERRFAFGKRAIEIENNEFFHGVRFRVEDADCRDRSFTAMAMPFWASATVESCIVSPP
jgi:hypothetical protein